MPLSLLPLHLGLPLTKRRVPPGGQTRSSVFWGEKPRRTLDSPMWDDPGGPGHTFSNFLGSSGKQRGDPESSQNQESWAGG